MERLKDQIAWISGGASGMGQATAELFAEEGAKVVVADIQAEMGQDLVNRIIQKGGDAIFHECDVSQEDAVRKSIDRTVEHFGGLQIVVNCAGVVHVKQLHQYSEQEWDNLMNVNVKSIFFSNFFIIFPGIECSLISLCCESVSTSALRYSLASFRAAL